MMMIRGVKTAWTRVAASRQSFHILATAAALGASSVVFTVEPTRSVSSVPIDDGAGQFSICLDGSSAPGYGGAHDVGGVEALMGKKVDVTEKPTMLWEQQTHALLVQLVAKKLLTVDELRRHVEALEPVHYVNWG